MNARTRVVLYIVVVGIALATILLMIGQLTGRVQRAEKAAESSQSAARDNAVALEDARTLIGRLGTQVKGLGGTPVVVPSDVPVPVDAVGPTGATGAVGSQGPRGFIGPIGPRGLPGPRGSNGASVTGATGDVGATGAMGATGDGGPPGPAGERGSEGPAGQQGPAGDKGESGPPGYPERFTFTDSTGASQTCTDPDGDRTYTCGPS